MHLPQAVTRIDAVRFKQVPCAALVFLGMAVAACHRPVRENEADAAALLSRLATARDATQQLNLLDALSSVHPDACGGNSTALVSGVRPLLDSEDASVAAKAGELVARWGDRTSASEIVHLLSNPNLAIRLSAIGSLATLSNPAAIPALTVATRDPVGSVRAGACGALGALGADAPLEPLQQRLGDPEASVRAAAARAVGQRRRPEEVALVLPLLRDADPGVVAAAALALGTIGDRRAVAALVPLVATGRAGTRAAAAAALAQIGDPGAAEPVLQLLSTDDPALHLAGIEALTALRDPVAVEAVLGLADEVEPRVNERLPYVLAQLYNPQQLEDWTNRLHAPSARVRATVALALGLAGEKRAGDQLGRLLGDPNGQVRGLAAVGLGLIGATASPEALEQMAQREPDPEAREYVRIGTALARQTAGDVASRLAALLADPAPQVRMFAADALGLLRITHTLGNLRCAEQTDMDPQVRLRAKLAVLRMNGAEI